MASKTATRQRARRKSAGNLLPLTRSLPQSCSCSPCWVSSRSRATTKDDDPAPVAGSDEPGVAHAAWAGLHSADGSFFVATHYWTFRLAGDDPAQRVGDSFQDTMWFTVA